MRQVTNLMAHSAYAALVALKGARFQMFGGRGLHEWLSGAEVNLVTDKTALLIWADIDELGQWEGIDGGEPDVVYERAKEWVVVPLGPDGGASQLLDSHGNTRVVGEQQTAEIKGSDLMVSVIRAQLNLP